MHTRILVWYQPVGSATSTSTRMEPASMTRVLSVLRVLEYSHINIDNVPEPTDAGAKLAALGALLLSLWGRRSSPLDTRHPTPVGRASVVDQLPLAAARALARSHLRVLSAAALGAPRAAWKQQRAMCRSGKSPHHSRTSQTGYAGAVSTLGALVLLYSRPISWAIWRRPKSSCRHLC